LYEYSLFGLIDLYALIKYKALGSKAKGFIRPKVYD